MEHIQRLCNTLMHEQTSSVWPQQQKGLFSSLGRHYAHKHTRTIIITIINLEALICVKTCAWLYTHTHACTHRKLPVPGAFHYSSIPYVWLSTENPDLRLESGVNLKDKGKWREGGG